LKNWVAEGVASDVNDFKLQGFCHTFNGITLKQVWQSNDMMNAFQETFRTDHLREYFQGAGQAEGIVHG
jgi:hypothetical protein